MTLIYIWLLYDWCLSFRNDILPIFLKWYFEITFIPSKKGLCWPSVRKHFHFEFGSAQSLKAIFDAPRFEMIYDFHFEMSKALMFTFWNALWLSFWNEGEKISYTKLFSSEDDKTFYWRKYIYYYYFRTQFFTQCSCPYACVEIKFLEKGDGLLCQILIILQC